MGKAFLHDQSGNVGGLHWIGNLFQQLHVNAIPARLVDVKRSVQFDLQSVVLANLDILILFDVDSFQSQRTLFSIEFYCVDFDSNTSLTQSKQQAEFELFPTKKLATNTIQCGLTWTLVLSRAPVWLTVTTCHVIDRLGLGLVNINKPILINSQ
jgi:hypothetical protein